MLLFSRMTIGCLNSLIILNCFVIYYGAYYYHFKGLKMEYLALILFLALGSSMELILTGLCH